MFYVPLSLIRTIRHVELFLMERHIGILVVVDFNQFDVHVNMSLWVLAVVSQQITSFIGDVMILGLFNAGQGMSECDNSTTFSRIKSSLIFIFLSPILFDVMQ